MYILEAKNGAGREAVDLSLVDLSAAPGPRSGSAPAVDLVAPALARPRQRPVPPLALAPPVIPSVIFPPGASHGARCGLPPVVAPLPPVDRPPAVDAVDLVKSSCNAKASEGRLMTFPSRTQRPSSSSKSTRFERRASLIGSPKGSRGGEGRPEACRTFSARASRICQRLVSSSHANCGLSNFCFSIKAAKFPHPSWWHTNFPLTSLTSPSCLMARCLKYSPRLSLKRDASLGAEAGFSQNSSWEKDTSPSLSVLGSLCQRSLPGLFSASLETLNRSSSDFVWIWATGSRMRSSTQSTSFACGRARSVTIICVWGVTLCSHRSFSSHARRLTPKAVECVPILRSGAALGPASKMSLTACLKSCQ